MSNTDEPRRFTGLKRRKTSAMVRVIDRAARWVIAVGGIGTIVAVLLVCVFLVSVVIPLFRSARVDAAHDVAVNGESAPPLKMGVDEFRVLGWTLSPEGKLQCFKLHDGKPLGEPQWIRADDEKSAAMTCCATAIDFRCKQAFEELPNGSAKVCVFGFADGSVRMGAIGFKTTFLEDPDVDESLRKLTPTDAAVEFRGGMIQRTPTGQLRLQELTTQFDPATKPVTASAIEQIDFSLRVEGQVTMPIFVARSADGKITVNSARKKWNSITDETTVRVQSVNIPLPEGVEGKPVQTLISGLGDRVFLLWKDGTLVRYDTRNLEAPKQVEKVALLARGVELTAAEFLLGKTTIMVGDSQGRLSTWCEVKLEPDESSGGKEIIRFTKTHELPNNGSPITCLATSPQSRTVAAGDAAGNVRLVYDTSERQLAKVAAKGQTSIRSLLITPKADGLLASNDAGITMWDMDVGHPEVTVATLIRPVWYEGFPKPEESWQTTSSTDDFEPKFGFWPLIFGTLKATFYSLLFGVPLALMAAIFTSEFLHPAVRSQIKPLIETMASLPSVVLGFLAGTVIAPIMESIVPATVASLVTVPLAFMIGAILWQLLPIHLAIQYRRYRFACMLLLMPVGLWAASRLGPMLEYHLLGERSAPGDLRLWLNHQGGSATPGWAFILLPVAAFCALFLITSFVHPWLREISQGWTRTQAAAADLFKFVLGIMVTLSIAWLLGWTLSAVGCDPRGPQDQDTASWSLVGTYVQRNALIVGFMMGFAIIPIIYTLADDALNTVPAHLRSASLAAGATPWQTLMRIVIPTAMSGLFSAVMIGLGRAVGETMIVLMGAGSTPILQMNMFNGFRTLSASIAIEMSEAARGTTHFRVLFLAALVLFAITFVVNTAAEVIRQRFRRRAYEL